MAFSHFCEVLVEYDFEKKKFKFLRRLTEGHLPSVDVKISKLLKKKADSRVHNCKFQMTIQSARFSLR